MFNRIYLPKYTQKNIELPLLASEKKFLNFDEIMKESNILSVNQSNDGDEYSFTVIETKQKKKYYEIIESIGADINKIFKNLYYDLDKIYSKIKQKINIIKERYASADNESKEEKGNEIKKWKNVYEILKNEIIDKMNKQIKDIATNLIYIKNEFNIEFGVDNRIIKDEDKYIIIDQIEDEINERKEIEKNNYSHYEIKDFIENLKKRARNTNFKIIHEYIKGMDYFWNKAFLIIYYRTDFKNFVKKGLIDGDFGNIYCLGPIIDKINQQICRYNRFLLSKLSDSDIMEIRKELKIN